MIIRLAPGPSLPSTLTRRRWVWLWPPAFLTTLSYQHQLSEGPVTPQPEALERGIIAAWDPDYRERLGLE